MLPLGGPKQRAVLVLLLLRADAIVPIERLVDELWGEEPPASAVHTLETYVSRLRATLEPHGTAIGRRGRGYVLEPGGAELDARRLEELVDAAAAAGSAGETEKAGELAQRALSYWRGLPEIDSAPTAPTPAEVLRLEELWRRALELRVDADLAAGRHDRVLGELRALVDEDPYNERLVAQLMVALYRSGRQAEAVEVYERMRRRISAELGLQPGRELQALSARIVRHEEDLVASPTAVPERRPRRAITATTGIVVAAVALSVAAAVLALSAARGGGGAEPMVKSGHEAVRVALILPRKPRAGASDPFVAQFVDGLGRAARDYGVRTDIMIGDNRHGRFPSQVRLARRIERVRYDLVIVASEPSGGLPLDKAILTMPRTRFVFIDAYYIHRWRALRQPNVTLVQFADLQAGYLAGYLSGLVERSRASRTRLVSIVAGMNIPQVTHLVKGFTRGVEHAAPGVRVLKAFSGDFVHREPCARLATRQIDAGSDIVFAPAGECGRGALAVAGLRGVLAVGADEDLSYLGAHILGSTVKHFDQAVLLSVRWFLQHTLPGGRPVVLGLDDDAVGLTGISPSVSPLLRQRLSQVATHVRHLPDDGID